jgi:hypothetical protein
MIEKGPLGLRKFEIKYGFEGVEKRNIFLHRNFFRFLVDLEQKIRESFRFEF